MAWNEAAGNTEYELGTSDDIYTFPETAAAVWTKQENIVGISVANGATTGFIPIEGVTIDDVGIKPIMNDESPITICPNPTGDVLNFCLETPFEIIDMQGRILLKSNKAVNV